MHNSKSKKKQWHLFIGSRRPQHIVERLRDIIKMPAATGFCGVGSVRISEEENSFAETSQMQYFL